MTSITIANLKFFQQAYCPPVTKVLVRDSEVEIHFTDKSISIVKSLGKTKHEAILEAIIKRTFSDSIDYKTNVASNPEFDKSLEKLYSIIEFENSKKISNDAKSKISAGLKAESKISKVLNGFNAIDIFSNVQKLNDEVYSKPKKKFKDFTQEEKRAYWRAANKRRKSKNW